jgi:hypothetical protein
VREQRDEFDGGFGQAVNRFLLVAGIIAVRDKARFLKAP